MGRDDLVLCAGIASSKLVKNATLKIYPGTPHGLTDTHKEQLNSDMLEFLKD
jgi:non-heme chloroperoxidase